MNESDDHSDFGGYPPGSTVAMRILTWREVAQSIGSVCMSFQSLEDALISGISYLLKTNDPVIGRIVSAEISFKTKADLVYSLFCYSGPAANDVEKLKSLLSRCFQAEAKRNMIIHSSWSYTDHEPELVLRHKRSSKFKKGYRLSSQEIGAENLDAIAEDLNQCARDVIDFLQECFPDYSHNHFALHMEDRNG